MKLKLIKVCLDTKTKQQKNELLMTWENVTNKMAQTIAYNWLEGFCYGSNLNLRKPINMFKDGFLVQTWNYHKDDYGLQYKWIFLNGKNKPI